MGGRHDCTNIADGMISIITDIGLDHMDILGGTIKEIAEVKAGIIKPNRDTIMYAQEGVTEIIEAECKRNNNTLHFADKNLILNYSFGKEFQKIDYKSHKDIEINLKGKCQIFNSAIALECIDILRNKGFNIEENAIKAGLKTVVHKARFETISKEPQVIFDGGHNENAIRNFRKMVNQYYQHDKKIYIVSILKSKDYRIVIKLLTEEADGIFIFTNRK